MSTFALRHFVAQHPHGPNLRKRRDRKLRGVRSSRANALWYLDTLHRYLLTRLKTAGVDIAEALRPHWPVVADAVPPVVKDLVQKQRGKIGKLEPFAVQVATKLVRKNLATVDDRLAASVKSSLGVDIRRNLIEHGPILEEMHASMQWNVELITSIASDYFDDIQKTVSEAWNDGQRWESIVDEIKHIGDVTDSRAELIARDQVNKMNGAFNRVRQTSLGIEKYEWQTADDERVRESHAELDGQVFDWDDPPIVDDEPANPGDPINCRCIGAPVLDLDEPEEEPADGEEPDEEEIDEEEPEAV